MKPGKDGGWPRYSRHAARTSTHYLDPVLERKCPFCNRVNEWPLSSTEKGQERKCRCDATFCSWRKPSWYIAGPKKRKTRKVPEPPVQPAG